MDLSTIEKKMAAQAYSTIDQVKQDFDLMFGNCLLFNGQVSPVAIMCKNLQKHFEKEMEKLPKTVKPLQQKKKSIGGIGGLDGTFAGPRKPRTSRESMGISRRSLTGTALAEQKFMAHVVRDLCRKQHTPYNIPFLQPVDPVALGIPHYTEVITNPMDLSTVRRKVDLGEYEALDEFEADVRLMFSNCYTFNPPGSEVFSLGTQLEAAFNTKWGEKQSFISQYGETARSRTKLSYEIDSSTEDDDGLFAN
jgi:bromodomain-containing factor 1